MTQAQDSQQVVARDLLLMLEQQESGKVWVVPETQLQNIYGLTATEAVQGFKQIADFPLSSAAAETEEMGMMLLLSSDAALFTQFLNGEIDGNLLRLVLNSTGQAPAIAPLTRH